MVYGNRMISVAAVLLNIFHPGRCFRQNLNETAVDLSTLDQKDGDEESIQVFALSKAHA